MVSLTTVPVPSRKIVLGVQTEGWGGNSSLLLTLTFYSLLTLTQLFEGEAKRERQSVTFLKGEEVFLYSSGICLGEVGEIVST